MLKTKIRALEKVSGKRVDLIRRQRGRPRKFDDKTENFTIRMPKTFKDIIVSRYGTLQSWIDKMLKKEKL